MSTAHSRYVRLDPSLYLPSAVQQAADAFGSYLRVTSGPPHSNAILIVPLSDDVPAHIVDEFLNFSLAASIDALLRPR